jgi:hypothetical protein
VKRDNNTQEAFKSKYKGVSKRVLNGRVYYVARKVYCSVIKQKHCTTEREAARAYDLMCLDWNLEPQNVFTKQLS